jgi:glucan phosphoethanolaminetransferase (alkaline phosphatase superfamily)
MAVVLLLLGTFYAQQINALFEIGSDGASEFVRLAFFWSAVLGSAAIIMISAGLLRRSQAGEKIRLAPSVILLLGLIALFFIIFYRTLAMPPVQKPLRPGEILII